MCALKKALAGLWSLGLMTAAHAQDFDRGRMPLLPSSGSAKSSIEISVPGPSGGEFVVPLELGSSQHNHDRGPIQVALPRINPYSSGLAGPDAAITILFSSERALSWKASGR